MNNNTYVVIMAGGIGSRFWPYSRSKFPKQFHDILGVGKTMLQQAADRFMNICPKENIYVVTNKDYKDLVKNNLPYLSDDQVLLEPSAKNTAPCIAYACYKILKNNPLANFVITPSDQFVQNEAEFETTLLTVIAYSSLNDALVTVGIVPTRPDTGYGYIQYLKSDASEVKKVKQFAEKPNMEKALQFLASGDFVWNSGMFIFNGVSIKKAFHQYMPTVAKQFSDGNSSYYTSNEEAFIQSIYAECASISFDYAVMEKAENVHVILGNFGWSDVGTWKSVYDLNEKSTDGNVIDGEVMVYNTSDCIIKSPKDKLLVINGLEGFIVAEFDGVLMICKKDEEQKVKDFLADVRKKYDGKFL